MQVPIPASRAITKLLIANRGEIAVRVIRSAHALGIGTVAVEAQIETESYSFFVTARLYDDGIIDPRDTRTVLGMSLSAVHSGPVAGRRGFGVFRM